MVLIIFFGSNAINNAIIAWKGLVAVSRYARAQEQSLANITLLGILRDFDFRRLNKQDKEKVISKLAGPDQLDKGSIQFIDDKVVLFLDISKLPPPEKKQKNL